MTCVMMFMSLCPLQVKFYHNISYSKCISMFVVLRLMNAINTVKKIILGLNTCLPAVL